MAYDSARGRVVLFGGDDGNYDDETWEWDGSVWTQRIIAGPSPRYFHAMAYDSGRARLVLFGGRDLGDTWEYGACPGDLDGNSVVTLADLAVLLADFGCNGEAGNCPGDLNGDGDTELDDLALLLANFGATCP